MGPVVQPDYCNAVAGVLTQLEAPRLHAALRDLEKELGRESSTERWGPRVIDLDLLAYADERRSDAELTLPHAGIAERNFVLQPWGEIAPDLLIPGLGRVAELAAGLPATGLWRIASAPRPARSPRASPAETPSPRSTRPSEAARPASPPRFPTAWP